MRLDGDLLRAARAQRGLTQADLAAIARITSRTVGTAERGGLVSADSARCLGTALGVPYSALLRRSAAEVRERLLERGLWPAPPPVPWAGRQAEIGQIVGTLESAEAGALLIISGASGMGKSALARHAVAASKTRFSDGVVWLAAPPDAPGDRRALLQLQVADALEFRDRLPHFGLVDRAAFDQAFRRLLWGRRRLLVLDDVADADFVRSFLGSPGEARVLVTTTRRALADELGGTRLELGPLPEEAALELLVAHLGRRRIEEDPRGARDLAHVLAGVPRSLHIAGRVLAREPRTRLGEYAARIASTPLEPPFDRDRAGPWATSADPDASFAGAYAQLVRHLPEASWDFFAALAVFEERTFTLPWASAAAGLSPTEAHHHLGVLADAYLVQDGGLAPKADDRETHGFHLDAQAHRVARFLADGGGRVHHLRVLRHARSEARKVGELAPEDGVARVIQDRALWRQCLDSAVRSICGGQYPSLARSPAHLVDLTEADPEELGLLADILVGLRSYLALAAPAESGGWLSVGVAAARQGWEPRALGVLTELLASWNTLALHEFSAAELWFVASSEAYEAGHHYDDAMRMRVWAAEAAWVFGGTRAAVPATRRAVECGRRWGVSSRLLAAALNNLAVVSIHGTGGRSRWAEAEAMLAEASRTAGDADDLARLVQCTARLNRAVLRRILGSSPADEDVGECLTFLRNAVDDDLGHHHLRMLAAFLDDLATAEPGAGEAPVDAWAILTGAPPDKLWRRLVKVGELVLYELGRLGWDPPPAFSPDLVRGVSTPEGRLGITDVVVGLPVGLRLGHGLAQLVPVDRSDRLLETVGAEQALQFVTQVSGPEHPLHQLLEGLVLLRAAHQA